MQISCLQAETRLKCLQAKRADQENSSPGLVTAPAAKSPPRRRQSVRTSSYDDPDRSVLL